MGTCIKQEITKKTPVLSIQNCRNENRMCLNLNVVHITMMLQLLAYLQQLILLFLCEDTNSVVVL